MTNEELKALCHRVAAIYEHADPQNLRILALECLSLLDQLMVAEEALQFEALTDEPSAIRAKHTLERMGKT